MSGQRRPLGKVEQTSQVTDRLDQVLDEEQAKTHSSKVEHVGRDGEHCRGNIRVVDWV